MESHILRPPVIAAWLVRFFIPDKQTEAIEGDLVEEFSKLASASGVAAARRWYWRQSINTVAHLMGTGFCTAPWLIAGAVLGGCLSIWYGLEWADLAMYRLINRFTHAYGLGILSGHNSTALYPPWEPWGIWVARLLFVMFVGCLVSLAVKGREMVTMVRIADALQILPPIRIPCLQSSDESGRHDMIYMAPCSGSFEINSASEHLALPFQC